MINHEASPPGLGYAPCSGNNSTRISEEAAFFARFGRSREIMHGKQSVHPSGFLEEADQYC